MKRTKKWTLIYAIGWLVIGLALVGISGYQWITLGQAMVSVGYGIGGACCIVPALIMFVKWHREEEIELEAYGRQFDEEVAKRQGQLRIDLNAEKEELKKQVAELEEQLKDCIRPKFKVNDKIFVIVNDKIEEYYIDEVLLKCKGTLVAYRDICKETTITEKNDMFATEQEAQAKLEELKGEYYGHQTKTNRRRY